MRVLSKALAEQMFLLSNILKRIFQSSLLLPEPLPLVFRVAYAFVVIASLLEEGEVADWE